MSDNSNDPQHTSWLGFHCVNGVIRSGDVNVLFVTADHHRGVRDFFFISHQFSTNGFRTSYILPDPSQICSLCRKLYPKYQGVNIHIGGSSPTQCEIEPNIRKLGKIKFQFSEFHVVFGIFCEFCKFLCSIWPHVGRISPHVKLYLVYHVDKNPKILASKTALHQ